MRQIPSTGALLAFEAASRHMSFQRAAEELHVTPGAVSRQIHKLEEQLGAALFLRHHKRIELTPRGQLYASEIRPSLQRLADTTARIREEARSAAISVCAYPSFAIRWFIPRWGRFHDAHPSTDLRLTTSLNPADFESGEYHLAIQVLEEGRQLPGVQVAKLLEVDTFPVCSPERALAISTPADLAAQTLLHDDPRLQDWPRWLATLGVRGIDGTRGLRFETFNLAIQAAIEGLGVAIAVGCLVEEDLAQGRLVPLFDQTRRSSRPIHLVYPDTSAHDPNVTALRDWLLREAAVV